MVDHEYAAGIPGQARARRRPILSVFVRLHQCERYFRLRLHERNVNRYLFRDEGVDPVPIPPLLTRSGAIFEEAITAGIAAHYRVLDCTPNGDDDRGGVDNALVVETAHSLGRERPSFSSRRDSTS